MCTDRQVSLQAGGWPVFKAGRRLGLHAAGRRQPARLQGRTSACATTSTTRALAALVGPVFDKIAGSLVDAFVKRADQVYGEAMSDPDHAWCIPRRRAQVREWTLELPPGSHGARRPWQASGLLPAFPGAGCRPSACWASGAARPAWSRCLQDAGPGGDLPAAAGGPQGRAARAFQQAGRPNSRAVRPQEGQGPRPVTDALRQRARWRYLQSAAMMACMRLLSAARAASSMNSRSPLALVVAIRTPESKVALAFLARSQFSAWALATFSSSAFFLARLLLLGLLFLLGFQLLRPCRTSFGALGRPWAAAAAGRRRSGARCDGVRRLGRTTARGTPAAGLLQDVLVRDVGRRRAVAEDLAAVLVDPLPLGRCGQRKSPGRRSSRSGVWE